MPIVFTGIRPMKFGYLQPSRVTRKSTTSDPSRSQVTDWEKGFGASVET